MESLESSMFRTYHEDFESIIGANPVSKVLLQIRDYPFAHEAGVFFNETDELFITSNQFTDSTTGEKRVQISRILLDKDGSSVKLEEIPSGPIHMANGGVNYQDGILFCAQGSSSEPSGLFKMGSKPPFKIEPITTSYMGRPFNSVNDVVVHPDGSIWFTDPSYGHDQGYKPKPVLPNQVYRYEPCTGAIRAMADGFGRPNGICFSPDHSTVYVTDTDQIRGSDVDYSRAASIYAFDVVEYHWQPFLVNRRLFAMADVGIPDGIKCDMDGNVYSGCGDGVHVWSAGGVLLGKILIRGGAANFCFGRGGQLFVLNEHRLWKVQLSSSVRGALLGI